MRRRDDVATGATPSLKRLLMGDPLSERDAWRLLALGDELNMLLRGVLWATFMARTASVLQRNALRRVLRCPMSFFDTNPVGRVLNRFSQDQVEISHAFPLPLRIHAPLTERR